jgi:hypothetical protein
VNTTTTAPRAFWETWDDRECVSRASSLESARRGCLNDVGRLLTIFDLEGRISALYRDGKEIQG